MTVRAANSQEAVFQAAALEIVFELALHMCRQRAFARRQVFHERRVVSFNQLLQKRLRGPMPSILARPRSPSTGVRAGQ